MCVGGGGVEKEMEIPESYPIDITSVVHYFPEATICQ
jgi:hypothetical protein